MLNWNGRKVDLFSAQKLREDYTREAARRALVNDVEQTLADIREDAALVEQYRRAEPLLTAESRAQLDQALAAGQASLVEVALIESRSLSARRAGLRTELHWSVAAE